MSYYNINLYSTYVKMLKDDVTFNMSLFLIHLCYRVLRVFLYGKGREIVTYLCRGIGENVTARYERRGLVNKIAVILHCALFEWYHIVQTKKN